MEQPWQQSIVAAEALQSDVYREVRRRIFRQLAESVIYEGIVSVETYACGENTAFIMKGTDSKGQAVSYRCVGQTRLSFGRIRLLPDTFLIREAGKEEAEACSLRLFVEEILQVEGTASGMLSTFAEELEQTLLKDTLAQYVCRKEAPLLFSQQGEELEAGVMDGHRYHPCYKSRLGFTYMDQMRYGPEFGEDITPLWLAIRKEDVPLTLHPELSWDRLLEEELGTAVLHDFQLKLSGLDCEPSEYTYVPVHPWQWGSIMSQLSGELHAKHIVAVGPAKDRYRAQQSIRTLSNRTSPTRASIKLSMNLVNTSSSRQLLPHLTVTAPIISYWLQNVFASDRYLREEARTVVLREVAAAAYEGSGQTEDDSRYGAIGCIWRESLARYLHPGEASAPFFALFATEQDGSGIPLIEPWLRTYGIEPWLTRLIDRCAIPVLHLAAVHGIATESHAQNMILIHEDGLPARVALKDFHEDVLYYPSFLLQPELCPDWKEVHKRYSDPGVRANFEAERIEPLRYLTLGALFFVNLAELAMLLADRYGYQEQRFWELTAERIHRYGERSPQWKARLEELNLFTPTTCVERLTYKRLTSSQVGRMHEVVNPLAPYKAGWTETEENHAISG
jgi:3,4-dihydroxybenzoyl-citryl-spermidine/N-citryl-spermidine--spermidine ligase